MVKIALVNMRCEKGDIDGNLADIARYIREADEAGSDFVCFPEMSITGYVDPGKYPRALIDLDGPEIEKLRRLSEASPAALMAGFIERNPAGKPFISQIVLERGSVLGIYRKITIKDEEEALFSPGHEALALDSHGVRLGIAICADIRNDAVFAGSARKGARVVFELAAPGLYGTQEGRNWSSGYAWWEGETRKYLSRYAKRYGLWIAVATQAGRTSDEDFPGGAYVFAPNGERLFASPDYSPGAFYLGLDFGRGRAVELQ